MFCQRMEHVVKEPNARVHTYGLRFTRLARMTFTNSR